jgi:hypothetical protein
MFRSIALAGVVGILLLRPDAASATPAPTGATAAAPATPATSSPAGAQPRVSPYAAFAVRRQAQAASGAGHAPAVPPSKQRTRRATSRVPQR